MSQPFAPYESVPDDDLGSAAAATVAVALGALIAVTLGVQSWQQIPAFRATMQARDLRGQELATVVTTVGWGVAAVLLGFGALLLVFRRGRGLLLLGSLVGVATTAIARFGFQWFTPTHPLDHALVFWGGVAVLLAAVLPATRRWVAGRSGRGMPPVTTATPLLPTSSGVVSTLRPQPGIRSR